MIELLVPYKRDCEEREHNRSAFVAHYGQQYDVNMIEGYDERSRAFNDAARHSTSQYIALADVDAIVPHAQMDAAVDMLEQGHDVVYPFTKVLNVHPNGDITDDWPRIDDLLVGLMVFFRRESFLAFGGENEEFKGYGWEDQERYYRALNNGYKVGRVDGVCHHLTHPRVGFRDPNFYHNRKLMIKERDKWISVE